ncbi:HAD family hydrolase [Mucilaginibacter glaciei]|uniref:phosphoglycolate phosphatase n=1 Tax=Mucilaginibacter glaciei TaxID=2772109 RepID=A0A926NQI4_9SPHI|nr:HAD hydrolase-like protein [Mucilaginibacter glaciei]MBD1392025.1 HAD hydrolase-like protein [Mucilaginibacter glaciei]
MAGITYNDIDPSKKAFIFELDDVLYPKKDYYYQVYYLFANLLEYTELSDAKQTTDLMIATYNDKGPIAVFNVIKQTLGIDEKHRANLEKLLLTTKLPLKLLLYQNILTFLQDVVLDRKKLFIVTNGDPLMQLNKLRQVEWHGLEGYLICYFANETKAKPETDVIELLMKDHGLERRDLMMVGNSETDRECAENAGVDYSEVIDIIQ